MTVTIINYARLDRVRNIVQARVMEQHDESARLFALLVEDCANRPHDLIPDPAVHAQLLVESFSVVIN